MDTSMRAVTALSVALLALSAQAAPQTAPPEEGMTLVVLKPSADWVVSPPGSRLPMALAELKNTKTDADVTLFVFPIPEEGVVGAARESYLQMKENATLTVEPLNEAEDGAWAHMRFSFTNAADERIGGKVFFKAFATAPGWMLMAMGTWPKAHDAAMVHDLDYIVATAHAERPSPPPQE